VAAHGDALPPALRVPVRPPAGAVR
jgi:hypothetical protein